jgi:Tfp pilus assembly protein PilO
LGAVVVVLLKVLAVLVLAWVSSVEAEAEVLEVGRREEERRLKGSRRFRVPPLPNIRPQSLTTEKSRREHSKKPSSPQQQ